MIRVSAFLLSALIAFSGVVLAGAKGVPVVQGTDIVICAGVNVTTITVGPDGEPIEKVEVCPDGHSIFAAAFALPVMPAPVPRLISGVRSVDPVDRVSRDELTPSARGPPVLI
ncbi:MAG: hypothetical protein VX874_06105 [Pseudomonadota bacterium]|nr:hypothetical protein [Pseudomonadota bacterium]